jgi:RNA recognition motif-containing protein
MASEAEETKAINELQNVEWMGRAIRVNKAEPRSGGGGGGGGGGRGGYGNGSFGGGGGYNGGGYGNRDRY